MLTREERVAARVAAMDAAVGAKKLWLSVDELLEARGTARQWQRVSAPELGIESPKVET